MKRLIALLVISIFTTPLLAKDPDTTTAQAAKSAPAPIPSPKTEKKEVKDYKSFLEYNQKHAIVRQGDLGEIQLDKSGIKFPGKKTREYIKDKDGDKDEVGCLSTDRRLAGVFNLRDRSFKVLDGSGKEIKKTKLSQFPKGVEFAFSDTRIFAISPSFDGPGGFEVFTSTGGFVKWIRADDVTGYAVSNTQKYFGITTVGGEGYLFRLYSMSSNEELWRQPIVDVGETQIKFSPDDKLVSIRIPEYWIKTKESDLYETVRKTNKLYIIDLDNRRLVSEEDYAD